MDEKKVTYPPRWGCRFSAAAAASSQALMLKVFLLVVRKSSVDEKNRKSKQTYLVISFFPFLEAFWLVCINPLSP